MCVCAPPPPTHKKLHAGPSSTVAAARHGRKTVPCPVSVYVPRTSRRPQPNGRRSQDRAMLFSRLRPENVTSAPAEQSSVPRPCHALFPSTSQERHVGPSRTVVGPNTVPCSIPVYVPRTSRRPKPNSHRSQDRVVLCPVYVPRTSRRPKPDSRRSQDRALLYSRLRPENVTSAQAEQSLVPRPCQALFRSTSRERHVGPSRTVVGPKTVPCSIPVYVPRTSRRPKPNSRRSQDRVVLYSRLRPKNVTSAQAEQSPVPRPCRALFLSTSQERHVGPSRRSSVPRPCRALFLPTSQDRHVGPSRTVVGPKTMPCSIPVYLPRTSRRPKPSSHLSQDRAILYSRLRPENVTSAQAEQSPIPRPCRALFLYTSQERHVGPKPNSRRSQDRVVLCSCLRPKNVTSAQAEQSPVPRPCRALFLSTSQERHVGPSRTVVGPKTMSCSVPVYVPRTSRRPKPNSRRSQDHVVLCSCLRPKTVTSAQVEHSSVPRPCHALFPSTSRERHVGPSRTVAGPKTVSCSVPVYVQERHVGPSRTVAGPKTVSCSVPVYVPRTSRRPKPNSRRSQDHVVLCSCLRPKNVTSAQAEQSSVPRPCRALFLSTSQDRHVGPSRTVVGPKTVPCSIPVYVPRTSRRPKPNSHRSPRPCHTLFTSTSRERHVGPSRAVASPKTVSCSVSIYVPRTSPAQSPVPRQCLALFPSTTRERHVGPAEQSPVLSPVVLRFRLRPKNGHVGPSRIGTGPQDRRALFRLYPKNVTVAQAEQSPVPRPCHALFSSTSRERHVGPSRTVVGPKTMSCSVPVYVPRPSRRPKPNSHRSQDHAMLDSRRRPENVPSAQAEQSPVPRPCRALFPSTSRERPAAQPPVPRPCLALFPSTS